MSLRQFHITRTLACLTSCFALFISTGSVNAQAVTTLDHHWQLWKINADGTGLARVAKIPGYECGSPQWSPDGTMIAYDTRPFNAEIISSHIAVIPADGSRPPKMLGPGGMPSWSPDGTHLVFHTYDSPQKIVVMKTDGSGRETLLNHWGSPRWMHDGNRIALIGTNRCISVFNLVDGFERILIGNINSPRPGFAVSPNGLNIVFGGNNGGLFLAALDARSMAMESTISPLWNSGVCYHASWSPDGKQIVFGGKVSQPGKPFLGAALHQLYVYNFESGGPPVLMLGQNTERHNTNPDWSPDGNTIIFASQMPQ